MIPKFSTYEIGLWHYGTDKQRRDLVRGYAPTVPEQILLMRHLKTTKPPRKVDWERMIPH